MVYGAAFCAVSNKAALAKAAYADSKTLTEEKREALFAQLKADAAMGYMVDSISAHALSTKMLRRCGRRGAWRQNANALTRRELSPRFPASERYNLNAISYDSAYALIQAALDAGVNLTEVVVDTVGDADQYTQRRVAAAARRALRLARALTAPARAA